MLSRLAENLFWTGRLSERADSTARLLDVTYHGLLESPPLEMEPVWEEVLEVLYSLDDYMERPGSMDAASVMEYLTADSSNPTSLVATIEKARDNARSVREIIPSEMWESLNTFYLELRTRKLEKELREQPWDLFQFVQWRIRTFVGVGSETMLRDDGWRFFTLGRMLERVAFTCRLLNVRYNQLASSALPRSFHNWVGVLKSLSAFEAFRKSYRGSLDPTDVVDFVILSQSFPRSVLFCLQKGEAQMKHLGRNGEMTGPGRLIGRLRSDIEYRDVQDLFSEGLHVFLNRILEGVLMVSDAVAHDFFRGVGDSDLQQLQAAS